MNAETQLDQIMAVMEAAFDPHWREAWNRQQVASSLMLPHTRVILIDGDGEEMMGEGDAAGFILSRRVADEEELLLVAVDPSQRRKGLGSKLLAAFMDNARENDVDKVFLEMRDANPAEALYRICGFVPIGRRRDYYRTLDGTSVDAITFARNL